MQYLDSAEDAGAFGAFRVFFFFNEDWQILTNHKWCMEPLNQFAS